MIAEKELQENYGYAYTISRLREVVSDIRIMDDRHSLSLLKSCLKDMEKLLQQCIREGYCEAEELKTAFVSMAEIKDLTFLGDMLENAAIPIMERWMQTRWNVNEALDDRYTVESALNGFLTIRDTKSNVYLHSKVDPMDEARKLIGRQYNCACPKYTVWGCGLGYQIFQLFLASEGAIPIVVYETSRDMIQYAMKYGVLSWVPEDVLQIEYVERAEKFFDDALENEGRLYLKTYITANSDIEQRNLLSQRFSRFVFPHVAAHNLALNFYRNRSLKMPYVSEIDHRKLKKEMVVIGAGPSLDHYMETLKSWQGKKTLIAAGTVWKKLLRAGIRPDFVVIIDPYDIVYQQAEGLTDHSATLLITTQANWRVAKNYPGKKYLIPVPLPVEGLNDYIEKEGITSWFAGGSVTVSELEFAVRMFADKVYLVGVDLALPGGMTHAEGTRYRKKVDLADLIPQEDVNGNLVYTNYVLIESKTWFELIMEEAEGIEFINMSDVGLKLKGTVPFK